jgi:Protein of unknown function (DUF1573)
MKFVVFMLGFIVIFNSCIDIEVKRTKKGIILVKSDSLNIGDVKLNEKMKIDFWLYNQGNIDLAILKRGASCGCTSLSIKDTLIKPNDSTLLKVDFTPPEKGSFQKSIVLETDGNPIYKTIYFYGKSN